MTYNDIIATMSEDVTSRNTTQLSFCKILQ